jgi:hypothetical protein
MIKEHITGDTRGRRIPSHDTLQHHAIPEIRSSPIDPTNEIDDVTHVTTRRMKDIEPSYHDNEILIEFPRFHQMIEMSPIDTRESVPPYPLITDTEISSYLDWMPSSLQSLLTRCTF